MTRDSTRDRIIAAAGDLLTEGGQEAVSTRAVSAASGVQTPAIYRIFGDKDGLLDAVATYGFDRYLKAKTALGQSDDPVDDLRRGWDLHVAFGLANPALYSLIYGRPRPGVESTAMRLASEVLVGQIERIARAGRLRVTEERAVHLIHSAGSGMTFALIALPPERRDPELSILGREAAIAGVATGSARPADSAARELVTSLAVAVRAESPQFTVLSEAERVLLAEWMERVTANS